MKPQIFWMIQKRDAYLLPFTGSHTRRGCWEALAEAMGPTWTVEETKKWARKNGDQPVKVTCSTLP